MPVIARGVAMKKSEYMAMGPTPGCYGRKAILRGDVRHEPHSPACRERVLEWLRRQEGANAQARLASAQMRQEASRLKQIRSADIMK